MEIKKNFRINSFAHNFALKQRLKDIGNGLLEFDSALYQYTRVKRAFYMTTDLFWTMDAA